MSRVVDPPDATNHDDHRSSPTVKSSQDSTLDLELRLLNGI